jgi:hypothetical protein
MERKGFKDKYWSTVGRRSLWGYNSLGLAGLAFMYSEKNLPFAAMMLAGAVASQAGFRVCDSVISGLDSQMGEAFEQLKDRFKSARITSLEQRTEFVYKYLDELAGKK